MVGRQGERNQVTRRNITRNLGKGEGGGWDREDTGQKSMKGGEGKRWPAACTRGPWGDPYGDHQRSRFPDKPKACMEGRRMQQPGGTQATSAIQRTTPSQPSQCVRPLTTE